MTNIIAAVADNGAIGKDNALLWHIREDLRYFMEVTMGCPVIMGRRTFESLGKPLPGRLNIVVSRSSGAAAPGILAACSIEEAISLARRSFSYREFLNAEDGSGTDLRLEALDALVPDINPELQLKRIDSPDVNPEATEEGNGIFIIGGGEIYRQAIPLADCLYITEVHVEVADADTFFPPIDPGEWQEETRSERRTDPVSGLEYEFVTYSRKR